MTARSGGGGGGHDSPPSYRSNPPPEYPAEARRLKQEGRVLIEVEVSAEGRVLSATVKRSSGVAALDEAALRAVRRWRFEPARRAGASVAARVEVPVQFTLTP
jgi:protein TonB